MANKINIIISAKDQASKPIRDISEELDGAASSSEKFKSAFGSLGGVLAKTAIGIGAAGIAAAGAGVAIGFNFNSAVEQAQTKLQAFMGDNERVAKTLAWVKQEAAATQFSFTEMADAAANLTPVAKTSGMALEDLVKQAEVLAALNPAEGLTGATFSCERRSRATGYPSSIDSTSRVLGSISSRLRVFLRWRSSVERYKRWVSTTTSSQSRDRRSQLGGINSPTS
ncbi:hypothetical protein Q0F99_19095 [Rathayibacter oskolensis]|uniref:hypothetical protein n=1 Tax=Rathayibacter oskolensis TaxID=1891671 RepID=UPI00265F7E30|nr:hypothetical protein [Rathayibacter oskolensis]WKK71447.1 hypothetical protein Q0F99_19095 [Rathayibacter oskolensis]